VDGTRNTVTRQDDRPGRGPISGRDPGSGLDRVSGGTRSLDGWPRLPRKAPEVITRMSELFVRTLREDPADAEVPSHRWLVRAGYVRRVAPGIYSWLPLGYRVLRNVERIVREEMDAIGAQEVHLPALLPREPYEATNRWTEYGPNLFRLTDRKGGDYLLGPTHEEIFTLLVKDLYSSYKDLPLSLYQIQTKYRDEARPRAGILRGREFVMKDSYSFDIDDGGLQKSYDLHRDAYIKVFNRLGFSYVIVSAMSGAMGGSRSEEFLAVSETGEDTFVRSPGAYAANVEARRRCPSTTCRPRTSRTPPTPRPSRPSSRWPTSGCRARTGRGRRRTR
jgi:prolyl-tRNA synthetase